MKLPFDYIRGLAEGEGTFTFSTRQKKLSNDVVLKEKTPSFCIMNERDEELLKSIRDTLGLKNRVYNCRHSAKSIGKGRMVMLIVRDFPQIKTIIPFFMGSCMGIKENNFMSGWKRWEMTI